MYNFLIFLGLLRRVVLNTFSKLIQRRVNIYVFGICHFSLRATRKIIKDIFTHEVHP